MPLQALVLDSTAPDRADATLGDLRPSTALAHQSCRFCGVRSGEWQSADDGQSDPTCPLCHLARHLERPRIDDEAMLVWLPEISQPALNVLVRSLHMQLRTLGESLRHTDALREDTPDRRAIYHTRRALAERSGPAADRLGTERPSALGCALHRLSPAARTHKAALMGGLRLLPLGRLFHDGADVYPAIVDAWRGVAARHAASANGES